MLKALGKVFVAIGKALVRVFKVAEERGLTEDIVTQAEGLVGEAQRQFSDNTGRRERALRHSWQRRSPVDCTARRGTCGAGVQDADSPDCGLTPAPVSGFRMNRRLWFSGKFGSSANSL